MKVKKFQDAEFEVQDIEIGDFTYTEKGTGQVTEEMVTAVKILYKDVHEVSVGSGWSIEQRKEFYKDPKKIIGKTITVKYFEESTNFTTQLLEGKSVKLEKDISGKDDYDRLLRYVIIVNEDPKQDNLLVNDHIVRQGYAQAVASPPDNRYRDLLVSAQEEALREKRGLWKECDYELELSDRRENDDEPTDPNCIIKGNISTRGYGRIYLLPGCDNYETVKIDFTKGEQYFCTEEEAQEADFRKATNCP